MRRAIYIIFVFLLGCQSEQDQSLTYKVIKTSFAIEIPAKGYLVAANATVINVPRISNGANNISWLAAEYSMVNKGDVIARLDDEAIRTETRSKRHELAMTEQDVIEKQGALNQELGTISGDIIMVNQEKYFAERYSVDDERIFSKLDIINAMQNLTYLNSKQNYLHWKNNSFNDSSSGEMGLLDLKKSQFQNEIDQLDNNLDNLEVKAPHSGLLLYQANWRGEKPKVGQLAWSNQTIARLPDTSNMKAKLFVVEHEAIDLGVGQSVSLSLLAAADQSFTGTVESVAPFPKSIKRKDPQQYFEVLVSLDSQNSAQFAPGAKLQATISVTLPQQKLTVPSQAVFSQGNTSYVYLYNNSRYEFTPVTLGRYNLSHVEITSGLTVGQQISLIDQAKI